MGEAPPSENPTAVPHLRRAGERAAIVVVGGEEDRVKRDRLRRWSGVRLEWLSGDDARRLVPRLRSGNVAGVVLLNRLLPHCAIEELMTVTRQRNIPVEYGGKAGLAAVAAALTALDARLAGGD